MTMRKMYDAVTPTNIPRDAQIVAGYLNGKYAWTAAEWAMFPNAVHVRISVRAAFLDGHVLDVEPGDATPAESVGWVKARRAAGADPSVYCNRSSWPQVRAAFQLAREPEPHYWIATASGKLEIPAGAVAAQYLLDTDGVDRSAVADYWPGVDSAQPHLEDTSVPAPKGREIMDPISVPRSDTNTPVRIECLTGSPTTGLIIRPILNPGGLANAPVFVENIYAWGSDKVGVGGNPGAQRLTSAHWVPLPGALWCDLEYRCADGFTIQPVG